ncbi:MAG: Pyrroline-5-carboxylate reductase [Chlamydiae bacterium]|nr:Pyrroline-5-carboxylate reductase [Chlamydiota bacterium]
MKISIIGCGKMGGGIASRLATEHELALYDHHKALTRQIANEMGVTCCEDVSEAVAFGEIVILAVKPKDLGTAAKEIYRQMKKEQLLVSILVGVTTDTLQQHFGKIPVLRIMPNLAVMQGQGVIGIADTEHLPQNFKDKVNQAFSCLGNLHWIPENQMDGLTAITGSGPAFLFVIIESIIEAGIAMGLSPEEAKKLAIELFSSTIAMLQGTDKHPADLKWDIASPSGTTIAGLNALEDHSVRAGIINALLATYNRAKEISEGVK